MRKEETLNCCPSMVRAFHSGSDNEGYGRLCSDFGGRRFFMGCVEAEIKFCPWCGTPTALETACDPPGEWSDGGKTWETGGGKHG